MNRAPSLSQKLANVQHMPVLMTATSASKDAPEGFILKDIIKMSFESTTTRAFLQQYLVNELCSTNNVFVKLRVLRCITAVLEDGHIEFKHSLRKLPQPFSEASKLRPHQPKSEGLVAECGRIRDMASRVLDMLFEDTPELRRKPTPSANFSDSNTSGHGSADSTNRITGFGNSSYTPPTQQDTTSTKLKKLFQSGGGGGGKTVQYDPSYVTMDPVPYLENRSSSSTAPGNRYQPNGDSFAGRDHVTGVAGGGWEDAPDSSPETIHVPRNNPTFTAEEESQSDSLALEAVSTEQERRMVDEITTPGGVKAAPPREMLASFVSRCRVLDCQSVVEYLRLKLSTEENQVVLRALVVIESLLRCDIPDILSHLDLVMEELTTLCGASHSTIKTKANKILLQLNAQNAQAARVQSARVQSAPSHPSSQTQSGSLFDVEGGGSREEEGKPAMSEEQASLFSGMSVSGEKKNRPKPVKQVKKPVKQDKPVAAPPSSAFEDLLGINDGYQVTPSQAPPTHAPPTQEEPLLGSGEDSLIEFDGGDEDFDPLKRTARSDSVRSTRTNSITTPRVGVLPVVQPVVTPLPQPTQPSSNGLLGDLAGVDLSKTSPMSTPPTAHREHPLFAAPQLLPPGSSAGSTGVFPSSQHNGPLLNQGGVLYAPVGPAYGGGVAQAGVAQQMPPMMYMPQRVPYGAGGQTGMVVGGEARPVQRATMTGTTTAADTPTTAGDSGFSFLGKSNKGAAFDFVQDEMRASKTK